MQQQANIVTDKSISSSFKIVKHFGNYFIKTVQGCHALINTKPPVFYQQKINILVSKWSLPPLQPSIPLLLLHTVTCQNNIRIKYDKYI